jgi:RHS repeat-associated protein
VHTDHLNTPRRISRPSDNVVVWRWDSDPFGTTGANEDPDGDSNLFSYNLRFPGQYFDGETGLHYNYFRNYDPAIGRYAQSDPIGLAGGLDTYGYVAANPLGFVDPFGLYIPSDTANCKVTLFPAFERRYDQRWEWFKPHDFSVVIPIVVWYHREVEVLGYAQKVFYWQKYNLFGLWEHNQNYLYTCTDTLDCGKTRTEVYSGNDSFKFEKFERTGTQKWSDPWEFIEPYEHTPHKLPPPWPE